MGNFARHEKGQRVFSARIGTKLDEPVVHDLRARFGCDVRTQIGERMPDNVVLLMARRRGEYIAGAFNILGRDTIYGRNWGAFREYPFLHFECCYYQAIEFAIKRGLKRVEAGAQGTHKLQRGYLPVPIYSAHWIPDAGFRRAVASFLAREREMVEQKIEHLAEYSPFRHSDEHVERE